MPSQFRELGPSLRLALLLYSVLWTVILNWVVENITEGWWVLGKSYPRCGPRQDSSQGKVTFTVTFPFPPCRKPASFISFLLPGVYSGMWGGTWITTCWISALPVQRKLSLELAACRLLQRAQWCLSPLPGSGMHLSDIRGPTLKCRQRDRRAIATLPDTEEEFRKPLIGRGAKKLFVPGVTCAFSLLLILRFSLNCFVLYLE